MAKDQRTATVDGPSDVPVDEEQAAPTETHVLPAEDDAGSPCEAAASEPPSNGETPAAHSPEELEQMLDQARATADEHHDALLRARAELDNLRKRSAREVENAHRYGVERLVGELLPVRDSMNMGIEAASDEGVDVAKVREGMELTLKMLDAATDKFGLQELDPQGEPFDPDYHQAISVQEIEGAESGTVITVVQKGYLLHDRLVRPAMVIVAK